MYNIHEFSHILAILFKKYTNDWEENVVYYLYQEEIVGSN